MSETDIEIFHMIHTAADPAQMAKFFMDLCDDYLKAHGPCPATDAFDLPESA